MSLPQRRNEKKHTRRQRNPSGYQGGYSITGEPRPFRLGEPQPTYRHYLDTGPSFEEWLLERESFLD